jgi:hypothetical protein
MAFEFFRKYQRPILFTAGIFALITFSVSQPLFAFFESLFAPAFQEATMKLPDGTVVRVTREDDQVGFDLMQQRYLPAPVLAPLPRGEDGDDRREVYAALRALARHYGIQPSMAEVDEAIQQAVRIYQSGNEPVTPSVLATRHAGLPSLESWRQIIAEALRIATFLRVQALATDTTDAALSKDLLRGLELITFSVASLDARKLEEELKQAPPTDEALQAWLDGLPAAEQDAYRHATNLVAIDAMGFLLDQFDAAEWNAELAGKEYGDATLRQRYDLDKEAQYRKPEQQGGEGRGEGDGEKKEKGGPRDAQQDPQAPQKPPEQAPQQPVDLPKPPGDQPEDRYQKFEDVRARVLATLQAEDVLRALWTRVQERLQAHLQPAIDARNAAAEAEQQVQNRLTDAEQKLAAKPEDADAKTAVEAAKQELETKRSARTEAERALDAARGSFSALAVFGELTAGRKGVATHSVPEPAAVDGLRELGPFGTWANPAAAAALTTAGDLSTLVQATAKGVFEFQVTKLQERPRRPFAEIKEQLLTDYYKKQANEQAKQKGATLEAALLRLGKQARTEQVAKIEATKETEIARKFDEWKAKLEADLAKAQQALAALPAASRLHRAELTKRVESLQGQLGKADERRAEFSKEVDQELEKKVAAEAKLAYAEVLEAAAAEAGFAVATIGPHRRTLAQEPRFQHRYPEATRYLFGASTGGDEPKQVSQLEKGDVTPLLEDATNRTWHLAVVTDVAKGSVADLTRRELLSAREQIAGLRMTAAIGQSFTIDALKQAYHYQRPNERPELQSASAGVPSTGTQPSGTPSGTQQSGTPPAGK